MNVRYDAGCKMLNLQIPLTLLAEAAASVSLINKIILAIIISRPKFHWWLLNNAFTK